MKNKLHTLFAYISEHSAHYEQFPKKCPFCTRGGKVWSASVPIVNMENPKVCLESPEVCMLTFFAYFLKNIGWVTVLLRYIDF